MNYRWMTGEFVQTYIQEESGKEIPLMQVITPFYGKLSLVFDLQKINAQGTSPFPVGEDLSVTNCIELAEKYYKENYLNG